MSQRAYIIELVGSHRPGRASVVFLVVDVPLVEYGSPLACTGTALFHPGTQVAGQRATSVC